MSKMSIYEPAMCCPTGLCGVSIDPELLRISTVLNTLKKNGIEVERYNLSNSPMEFMTNIAVNKIINEKGIDELPIVVLDGEIIITGRYPSNDEFIKLFNLPKDMLTDRIKPKKTGGCNCKGGCC